LFNVFEKDYQEDKTSLSRMSTANKRGTGRSRLVHGGGKIIYGIVIDYPEYPQTVDIAGIESSLIGYDTSENADVS
jgi:hypothetical protein